MMTVDQLSARFEITDCLQRYGHAVDRRRWSLMASVFHEDATYQFFNIEGGWRDFLTQAQALIDPMEITQHQLSNITIRFDGDTAYSETYLHAYHLVPADYQPGTFLSMPGGGVVLIGGRYIDRFTRRGGIWRIQHRHGLVDWRHDLPANDGGLSQMPKAWRGQHGKDDASLPVIAPWL